MVGGAPGGAPLVAPLVAPGENELAT